MEQSSLLGSRLAARGPMPLFLDTPSRFLFFTGKGGVGKTTLACATAIRFADAGKRILGGRCS